MAKMKAILVPVDGSDTSDRAVRHACDLLDAGLAVLSFASGSVLGAFLLGTLAPSVRERDTFAGMIAGLIVMTVVWWATPIAFTWYVLIGAVSTCVVAFVARQAWPDPA